MTAWQGLFRKIFQRHRQFVQGPKDAVEGKIEGPKRDARTKMFRRSIAEKNKLEAIGMTTKSEFLLSEALSMSPDERARLARCLIQSLEKAPSFENIDEQWIRLAQKRFAELEDGSVQPLTWEEIKEEVRS